MSILNKHTALFDIKMIPTHATAIRTNTFIYNNSNVGM